MSSVEPLGRSKLGFIGQPNKEACTSHCLQFGFSCLGKSDVLFFLFIYFNIKYGQLGASAIFIFKQHIQLSESDFTHQRSTNCLR